MFDQGCGREASPYRVRRQSLADTRASKLKGKYGTIKTGVFLLMKFLVVEDTNILCVNIELTKIKITVVINLQ
jgi:hypothetical protein